jgi:hypothetical protein
LYFYILLLDDRRSPHDGNREDGKDRSTAFPRKHAHNLNIFAEKITRARRVQFSPHETATQEIFFPHLSPFHCPST